MEKIKIKIGESFKTAFSNDAGVFQDGTVPLYRDVDGKLWGMMHSDDEGRSWKFDRWVLTFLRLFLRTAAVRYCKRIGKGSVIGFDNPDRFLIGTYISDMNIYHI